jgi:hypothetical protein
MVGASNASACMHAADHFCGTNHPLYTIHTQTSTQCIHKHTPTSLPLYLGGVQVVDPQPHHLAMSGSRDEKQMLQGYAAIYARQISDLLLRMPRPLLLLLKASGCVGHKARRHTASYSLPVYCGCRSPSGWGL